MENFNLYAYLKAESHFLLLFYTRKGIPKIEKKIMYSWNPDILSAKDSWMLTLGILLKGGLFYF